MSSPAGFDRLARLYRPLELLAFGRDLERARFCHLGELRGRRSILVLGEGDGRCLARLARIASDARIRCVDASGAMVARAAARLRPAERERVTLERGDAFSAPLPAAGYDAVVTLFFLDCFTPDEVARLAGRVAAALRPEALWLWADFVLPPRGAARLRARAWVGLLYAFFRWQTGISARALPPSEAILENLGFRRQALREFQHGLVRSAIFARPLPPPGRPSCG